MTIAVPLERPTDSASHVQSLQFLVSQALLKVQTSALVQVLAVQGGGLSPCFVDVIPLADQIDGNGNIIPQVRIWKRPVSRLLGGTNAAIVDPAVNDIGIMQFMSRDVSAVLASRKAGPPPSWRSFSMADGVYIGAIPDPANPPTQYVWLSPSGIQIVSPTAVLIQAPTISMQATSLLELTGFAIALTGNVTNFGAANTYTFTWNGATIDVNGEITDALGKVLGTHRHSGVTTGGGTSGPPV